MENCALEQKCSDLKAAKEAQEEEFRRNQEAELLRFDSMKTELSEQLTALETTKDAITDERQKTLEQLLLLQAETSQKQTDMESLVTDLKSVIEQKDHELEELNIKHRELEEKYQVKPPCLLLIIGSQ